MGSDRNPDGALAGDPKLPLKLHERLGDDAMPELLTLLGDLGAEARAEFEELREADARLERTLGTLEKRTDAGFAEVRQQISDLKQQIADVKAQVVGVQGELIKGTFVFWLGTIGIVLLLIRFPR